MTKYFAQDDNKRTGVAPPCEMYLAEWLGKSIETRVSVMDGGESCER